MSEIAHQNSGLVRYDAMCRAIDAAYEVDEVKDIRDKARAWEVYSQQAHNIEAERRACEIRLRAERRAGRLYAAMEKAKGAADGTPGPGRGNKTRSDDATAFLERAPKTLAELGISKQQASDWQRLAEIPDDEFEAALAGPEIPTTQGIINRTHGMAYRTSFNTGNNDWFTPPEYVDLARSAIDLDPASHPIAQERVLAAKFFTLEDDGLKQEWHGKVWMNPPYSQPEIGFFIDKVISEIAAGHVSEAIVLTHNSSDTRWFHTALDAASRFCLTRGRISFKSPDGAAAAPVQGQAFFYFGENVEKFETVFSAIGKVSEPKPGASAPEDVAP